MNETRDIGLASMKIKIIWRYLFAVLVVMVIIAAAAVIICVIVVCFGCFCLRK